MDPIETELQNLIMEPIISTIKDGEVEGERSSIRENEKGEGGHSGTGKGEGGQGGHGGTQASVPLTDASSCNDKRADAALDAKSEAEEALEKVIAPPNTGVSLASTGASSITCIYISLVTF